MLPPVRTISGSSGSYQNSTSLQAGGHLLGEPLFPGQAADADRDVNPNHAGKLNILLLNGPEAVSDDLSELAEKLGLALDVPRRDGETASAYVQRLAATLERLSPLMRAEAEQALARLLRGVKLQTLITALQYPAGPEAARIVALLEMQMVAARDLATRTVLTSYAQNGGADIDEGSLLMQGPPTRHEAETAARIATQAPAPSVSSAPDAEGLTEAAFARMAEGEDVPVFHHGTDNIFGRTSASPTVAYEVETLEGLRIRSYDLPLPSAGDRQTGTLSQSRSAPAPLVSDARTLQALLTSAFERGESADPVIQAKAAMELLAGAEVLPENLAPQALARPVMPDTKPFIDYTRPPPPPRNAAAQPMSGDMLPALLVLKGWTEETILPGLPVLPAPLEAEAALAAALTPHAGPEPDGTETGFRPQGRGIAANDTPAHHRKALSAAEEQLLRNADEAAGLPAGRPIDVIVRPLEKTPTEALLTAALQLGKEALGTGPAHVPYPLSDERDEDGADRRGYRSSAGEGDEDDADAETEGDPSSDETDDYPDETLLAMVTDGQDNLGTDDLAYDLYQRMAGWS